MYRSSRMMRRGFTLVELLVVIGVIAVVAALLLPALQGMRQKANTAICAHHIRQIYQASVLFSQDHDGRLPRPSVTPETPDAPLTVEERDMLCWLYLDNGPGGGMLSPEKGALWKYLGGDVPSRLAVVNCPGDRDERTQRWGLRANRNFTYAFNSNIRVGEPSMGTAASAVRLAAVLHPSEKIMIYEEMGPNDAWCASPGTAHDDLPASRHGTRNALNPYRSLDENRVWKYLDHGRANHCFFDGHVELLAPRWIIKPVGRNDRFRSHGPLTTEPLDGPTTNPST